MRIGIDGRCFFSGNPSGKIIVRQLLRQLIVNHPEHEYFVFLSRCERDQLFPFPNDRVHLLYLPDTNGFLNNCLFLPRRARKLDLDVCLLFYFSPLAGRYKKIVWINDIIFLEFPEYFTWKEKVYYWPMRFLSRRADRICTLSQNEKERMTRLNYAAVAKIDVVHLGMDDGFSPLSGHDPKRVQEVKTKYNLPDRFLLYVGRLNERKNILTLLKAVKTLADKNIKLVLAGKVDGKMFDLQVKIKEFALQDRVLLLGQVPEMDLPVIYALATVFCCVSFVEGSGLTPLEAMASGVPLVVSDRDSLPEVCADAAIYVDPQKPEDIAAAIDRLLMDGELRVEKRAKNLLRASALPGRRAPTSCCRSAAWEKQ